MTTVANNETAGRGDGTMRAGEPREAGWRAWILLLVPLLMLLHPGIATAQKNGLTAHDSSLPIEVTADRLTVEQNDRIATFAGNVEAVQGELVLRADRVRVAYAFGAQQTTPDQVIRRIEAEGNVVISTPEDTAKAGRAVYDVLGGTMQLEGNVVLVRGENVIEGARLDIDLEAGRAVMTAGAENGGRVRATFVPARDLGAAGRRSGSTEAESGTE